MHYDIIIIGSGIVGLTAALALADSTPLRIAILEAKETPSTWQKEKYDHRVSAISLAAKNIFHNLHVWKSIHAKRVSPYTKMMVWDAGSDGAIQFDCREVGEAELGYIIEDNVMRACLLEKIRAHAQIELIFPVELISLQQQKDHVELHTSDGKIFQTKLLIGADGANSWVRTQAGIELKTWNYDHTAIVASVQTENSHQQTAWQRFLLTGPLAFLPLQDEHMCSIVWSVPPDEAEKLLSLDDAEFQNQLTEKFANKLGKIISVSARYSFPLHMRHAKHYVQPRLALIGDAAHTIHPLAGQGVNLGLLDAVCLVEVIADAVTKSRDFSSLATLRRYERWRKSDNLAMLSVVEILKNLFASEKKPLQTLRGLGLNVTNHIPFLKSFFANYALGKRSDMPAKATAS